MSPLRRALSLLSTPLNLPTQGRYALAMLTAALAIAMRSLPHRLMDEGSPFLFFSLALVVAAVLLGTGPALVCLAISVVALVTLFTPAGGWLGLVSADATDLSLFLLTALGLITLLHGQRAARAQAEEAKRLAEDHARQLEHEVAERRRVEAALRQSNTDLEDFTHAVSHDLKQPLRGISLTAEFLLEDYGDTLDAAGKAKLERLVQLPKQMSALLTALLEYSRLGQAELGLRPADLGAVVESAVEPLRPWLTEQRAEIVIRGPFPSVRCDAARVTQVLSNLITNAVKYNDAEVKRVEIGVRRGGAAPVFYVADNGIGIAADASPRVFRMFTRLHAPGRYGDGTGSGLAMVKKTVERHGGRIWFHSEPGRGTTFCFTLGAGGGPSDAGAASVGHLGAEHGDTPRLAAIT